MGRGSAPVTTTEYDVPSLLRVRVSPIICAVASVARFKYFSVIHHAKTRCLPSFAASRNSIQSKIYCELSQEIVSR